MKENYYITTTIPYASAKPHIGNTYEIILTDAIARFKRLEGYNVYFQTGIDEHGQKVGEKSKEKGISPQAFVDEMAQIMMSEWDIVNTSYDAFVRTTDPKHKKLVQDIFQKLYDKGDIYKSTYEGWYCTPCESFYTDTQVEKGMCPDCEREVNKNTEEAYFLKLSKYADKLIEHINKNPNFLLPNSRKNEMLKNFLLPGLQDLCVTRSSITWGVPVPFDEKHIIYVWIDALPNYITFLGYDANGNHNEKFNQFWPADVHINGKDVFRFHSIYWPILLMALDLTLPKTIFGHPWLLMDGGKMGKSTGNVLYADELVSKFGADAIRYFVLHETPYSNDGIINEDLIIERTNSDLANTLGNLVNRTISMAHKYFEGIIPQTIGKTGFEPIDEQLINEVLALKENLINKMNNLEVGAALEEIFIILRKCNKYIDDTTPWILGKDETKKERLGAVLYNLLESIRFCAVLLQPFLPETAEKIFYQLNTDKKDFGSLNEFGNLAPNIKLNNPEPLFIRIETKE